MRKDIEKEKAFVSIIVNVEDGNDNYLKEYFDKIDYFFCDKFEIYEYIIVNNAFEINLEKMITEISKKLKGNVTVVNLSWRHNIEDAMNAGLDLAIGDFVFEFDKPVIDFDLGVINEIYYKCLEGYDVVSAVPKISSSILSRFFYAIFQKLSYKHMTLTTENFRIVSRRALNRVLDNEKTFKYRKALYHYSGFNTTIIKYDNKQNIKTSHKLGNRFDLASDIFVYYTNLGTKICVLLSLVFLLLSVSGGLYALVSYFARETIQSGWTTTMLFLSGSFTGLFFILAIISKYLETVIKEIQSKPRYIYKSINKISNK